MTFEKLETVGFSFLQLDPAVFYNATVKEIMLRVDGERERRDDNFKATMEAARFTTGALIRPNLSKGSKSKSTRQLFPFPWDIENEKQQATTLQAVKDSRERILKRDSKKAIKKLQFTG